MHTFSVCVALTVDSAWDGFPFFVAYTTVCFLYLENTQLLEIDFRIHKMKFTLWKIKSIVWKIEYIVCKIKLIVWK